MDHSTANDEALISQIANGDQAALSMLYDRYGRLVFSIAMAAMSGDGEQAAEIAQDVFLRIWQKAETYQNSQGKVVTWIARIARNRSIDMIRRMKVRPEGNQISWEFQDGLEWQDERPSVEETVEISVRRQKIRRALASLPESQRLALHYAFFYGYTNSEIAARLQEPLGTVKTRLRLGMQKLRLLLDGEMDDLLTSDD